MLISSMLCVFLRKAATFFTRKTVSCSFEFSLAQYLKNSELFVCVKVT